MVKNVPANAKYTGGRGSVPGLGRSLGVGNSNSLQFSCLENSIEIGAWWGHRESNMIEHAHTRAHTHTHTHTNLVRASLVALPMQETGSVPGEGSGTPL